MNDVYNKDVVSWTQFIDKKCLDLFGTLDLDDKRVSGYYLECVKRDEMEVFIDKDDLHEGFGVVVFDPDEDFGVCIEVFDKEEDALKFIKDNNLNLKVEAE